VIRGRLEAFVEDVFALLPRADQRARGQCYLPGLLLDGRRKSIEPMTADVILVTSGTFNLYRDVDGRCRHRVFAAGSGFVERAGQVHIGRNQSTTTPVEIIATYFNVPADGSVVIDQPDPGVCHF
jgi:hypothetical protein